MKLINPKPFYLGADDIECVVFDFDGTLVDTNTVKREAFLTIAAGTEGGLAAMRRLHGRVKGDRFNLWRAWARELGLTESFATDMSRQYTELVDPLVANAPEMRDAGTLLAALREARKTIFLSSATPQDNLVPIIEARGWTIYFEGIFGYPATKIQTLKNKILPRFKSASRIVVVGDGMDDKESALLAGCNFVPVGDSKNRTLRNTEMSYSLHQVKTMLISNRQLRSE